MADVKTTIRPILSETANWFMLAMPNPTVQNFTTQLGVHFEEVAEMLVELTPTEPDANTAVLDALVALKHLAQYLKTHTGCVHVEPKQYVEYLDSMCDQIVTAVGCAHMARFDIVGAMNEVNRSNYSKFVDGKPQFDENMKITKGPDYRKADLSSFV